MHLSGSKERKLNKHDLFLSKHITTTFNVNIEQNPIRIWLWFMIYCLKGKWKCTSQNTRDFKFSWLTLVNEQVAQKNRAILINKDWTAANIWKRFCILGDLTICNRAIIVKILVNATHWGQVTLLFTIISISIRLLCTASYLGYAVCSTYSYILTYMYRMMISVEQWGIAVSFAL